MHIIKFLNDFLQTENLIAASSGENDAVCEKSLCVK